MKDKGKKIYRTAMLAPFRLASLVVIIFFYHDLYLGTFQEETFLKGGAFSLMDVMAYHLKYPTQFFIVTGITLVPFLYYGFIRGVYFYERGLLLNRGLPFLNTWLSYQDVKNYKIVAPHSTIALFTQQGDIQIVMDGHIERVIAILDQHGVSGNLAQDGFVRLMAHLRKFFYLTLTCIILLYIALKFGWLRALSY